jgi:predicted nucleic acid-binding protein
MQARQRLELARQHGLSVDDAAYVELAMRLGLPLASKDESQGGSSRGPQHSARG